MAGQPADTEVLTQDPPNPSRRRPFPSRRIAAGLGLLLWLLPLAPLQAADRVVLQLRWDHQFQFAGYYAALWQGYYREAGLEVELRPAFAEGRLLDTTQEVAAGRADFGVGGADILQARDRGIPLVVLASVFQHSAAEWYARREVPLHSPADLVGKRVLRRLGDLIDVELQAVLKAEGIGLDSFTTLTMADGDYWKELLEGRADVVPGYAISGPFVASRYGIPLNRLRPSAYGIDFYGDSLFTRQELLEQNPDLAERFTAASLKGWRYALEHPQEIAERITGELPRHIPLPDLPGFNRFQAEAVARLMLYPTVEPGHTNPERWRTMQRLLFEAGVLQNPPDDQPLVYDALTRQRTEQLELRRQLLAAVIVAVLVAILAWLVTLRRTLHHLTRDLRQRRAELEAVIHSMGDGLVIQDRQGRIQTINPVALEMNGFTDEAQARRVFEQLQGTGQDYRMLDASGRELPFEDWPLARARRFETLRDQEVTIIDQFRGRNWTARFTGSPVRDAQGEIGLYAVTMQDITRQRQVEAEIRALNSELEQRVISRTRELEVAREALEFANHRLNGIIEGSRDLIAALDRDFRFIAFNNAYREEFRKLFGRHLELGMTLPEALGHLPEEQESALEIWRRALAGEEFTLVRAFGDPGGERNVYEFTYTAIRDQRGTLLGASHLVRDITDRVRAEENSRRLNVELERLVAERTQELEEARRVADAANRAKSEFLANMSHEIRTPMTAIMGYADVLLAHVQDPDNRQCVETIKRNGHHLVEIIDDILDLSKIEAGKLEVERQRFSPEQVVADVHSLMEVRARERGIPLRVEYQGLIPATIESDPTRLRQVLANLVGNAIKFTERGWVRLVVRLLADDMTPRLEFQVIDTGIGISQEQVTRLFKPFSQADTSVTRRFGGTGLGLAICRRLVEILGGEITVDSAPNQGSTFTFTITTGSLAQVPLVEPGGEVKPPAVATTPVSRVEGRILVVDDRHEIRMLIQHYLESAGARVTTAQDGQAGVERALAAQSGHDPFDLVVMDMQMPVLDGYQATARLRAAGFRRPIIALTAAAMQGDREKCLAAGCDDYLSKPVDGFELVEHIARHLARSTASAADDKPPAEAGGCRVLLVDDSEDACRATGMLLEMLKYTVSMAHSGREALERVRTFHPQAVVLDIGLPDLDGYQVLEQMKGLAGLEETVFIALSGRGEEEDRQRARQVGFHHHLIKPAQISDLAALLPCQPG